MLTLQIGPLAFPTGPLLWLLALFLGHALATAWARRRGGPAAAEAASQAVWRAALAGFAVSRLLFVLPAWEDYAAAPWRALDIRDGGWAPAYGALAAAAVLAWQAARQRPLWAPLGAGGALVLLVWGLGSTALGLHERLPVPDVPVVDLQGRASRLPTLAAGQPTVVNLWASWCGPCRAEMPVLAAAQARHPGVRFLFVNQGEDAATVQRFLGSLPFALQGVWLDRAARSGPAAGSTGLPTTLFFDAQGQLAYRHFGVLNAETLAVRLRPLLSAPAATAASAAASSAP
jgi:thiol-disulfide isomerase/thioredoxin